MLSGNLVFISKEEFERLKNEGGIIKWGVIHYLWKGRKGDFMSATVLGAHYDAFFLDAKGKIYEVMKGNENDVFIVEWEVDWYIVKDLELFVHYVGIRDKDGVLNERKVFYQARMRFMR